MGAAGDMLTAALFELLPNRNAFLEQMNALGLHDVQISAEQTTKRGITGTQMHVVIHGTKEESHDVHLHDHVHHAHHPHEQDHPHESAHMDHHHSHTSFSDVTEKIQALPVSENVKSNAIAVYRLIAEAESHSHGKPLSEIHFHEVGTMDAIADIVGVCLLMEMLSPDKVIVSPVQTGSGAVRCAHGILPVPAPATAYILRSVPTYGGDIEGELCTPTGAALLRHFADAFSQMPVMQTEQIGYGFGKKDFDRLNCVRAFLGETADSSGQVTELICNLDDMTGEELGFAQEMLLEAGARDVFTIPVTMKKSRPGVMLVCICTEDRQAEMLRLMFRYTTTLGVRTRCCDRYTLERQITEQDTPYGIVRMKTAQGFGTAKAKPEYEDLASIAREQGMTLQEIRSALDKNSKS